MMELVPVTLRQARAFVDQHHRHSEPPQGWLFGVGLHDGHELVGVAIAGRPMARPLQDGRTLEVTRLCTLGARNASSRLYGAICRAGAALGYTRAITYTLPEEGGSSLRASGFTAVERLGPRPSWSTPGRPRQDETLFGARKRPTGPKLRWERAL